MMEGDLLSTALELLTKATGLHRVGHLPLIRLLVEDVVAELSKVDPPVVVLVLNAHKRTQKELKKSPAI